jgi:hypothetical protein
MNGEVRASVFRYTGQWSKSVIGLAIPGRTDLEPGMDPIEGWVNEYGNVYTVEGQYVGELGHDFEEVQHDHLPDQVRGPQRL